MKEVIFTKNAPEPIGPYSQAIRNGNMLFVSGQIPINPETGKLIEGDISVQTDQVMKNICYILAEAGFQTSDVIKASIFIKDMAAFPEINKVYGKYFTSNPPAREVVAVNNLPLQSNIMISLIAMN